MSYVLKNDEVILLEKNVSFGKMLTKHKLVLTNKNILMEKEKGLFQKHYKVVEIVPLDSIKVYKDNVQVKQKNKTLIFQTVEKNFSFQCETIMDATLIRDKIIVLKTDSNILNRATKKVHKVGRIVKDAALLTGAIVSIPVGIKALGENKDKIVDIVTTMLHRK